MSAHSDTAFRDALAMASAGCDVEIVRESGPLGELSIDEMLGILVSVGRARGAALDATLIRSAQQPTAPVDRSNGTTSFELPAESIRTLAGAVAEQVIERLRAPRDDGDPKRGSKPDEAERASLPDDAYVDQRCGLVPKDIFLRLYKCGELPGKRIGHRVLAKWGDVKAALAADGGPAALALGSTPAPPKEDDGLDALRARVGLLPKAR